VNWLPSLEGEHQSLVIGLAAAWAKLTRRDEALPLSAKRLSFLDQTTTLCRPIAVSITVTFTAAFFAPAVTVNRALPGFAGPLLVHPL